MSEIINKAIDILRTKGWTKGVLHDRVTGQYCTEGAINAATLFTCRDQRGRFLPMSERIQRKAVVKNAIEDVISSLDCECSRCRTSIVAWNDQIAKDVDEVIGVLKLAGERLDAAE